MFRLVYLISVKRSLFAHQTILEIMEYRKPMQHELKKKKKVS